MPLTEWQERAGWIERISATYPEFTYFYNVHTRETRWGSRVVELEEGYRNELLEIQRRSGVFAVNPASVASSIDDEELVNRLSERDTPSPNEVENALAIEFGDFENGEDVLDAAVEAELGRIVPDEEGEFIGDWIPERSNEDEARGHVVEPVVEHVVEPLVPEELLEDGTVKKVVKKRERI